MGPFMSLSGLHIWQILINEPLVKCLNCPSRHKRSVSEEDIPLLAEDEGPISESAGQTRRRGVKGSVGRKTRRSVRRRSEKGGED